MFLRKVFNIFIKQNSNREILGIRNIRYHIGYIGKISGIRNIGYQKYRVSEILVIRNIGNIGYQKYRVSEISGIRNIRYISVKGLSLDQKKQN